MEGHKRKHRNKPTTGNTEISPLRVQGYDNLLLKLIAECVCNCYVYLFVIKVERNSCIHFWKNSKVSLYIPRYLLYILYVYV